MKLEKDITAQMTRLLIELSVYHSCRLDDIIPHLPADLPGRRAPTETAGRLNGMG